MAQTGRTAHRLGVTTVQATLAGAATTSLLGAVWISSGWWWAGWCSPTSGLWFTLFKGA